MDTKNCVAVVAVLVRGERYLFELQARGSKYVAVGLSEDSKMVILRFWFFFVFQSKFFTSDLIHICSKFAT